MKSIMISVASYKQFLQWEAMVTYYAHKYV